MSITIHQQPQLFTPVYNPMRFVVASTNYNQTNFNYVVDVYTSGHSGYTRMLFPPDPTTGHAAPDIQGVLESLITYDFSDTTYGFQRCTNSIKAYEVKFGEQYGPNAGIVTYPNLTVTGLKYAWNGVFSPSTFRTFNYQIYTPFNGNAILSNAPTTQYYGEATNHAYQYMLNDTSGAVYFAEIKTYNESGTLLGTYKIENPYQSTAFYTDKMIRVAVGYDDLNNATLYSGSQPVITGSVSYYTVQMTRFNGNATTNLYTYTTECSWHNTSPVALHFLNRDGGFDVFNFRLQTKKFSESNKEHLQKNLGSISGNSWSYGSQDRGKKTYNNEITDKWILESDWLNDEQSMWLQELIESTEVFYHDGTSMIPVNVNTANYEVKTIKNMDKLFSLSVEIEFSNKRWAQRG